MCPAAARRFAVAVKTVEHGNKIEKQQRSDHAADDDDRQLTL